MTKDDLFLENHRYLGAAFFVLPLPSGRIAILTPRRDHFTTVDSWEEAMRMGPQAAAAPMTATEVREREREAIARFPRVKLNLTEIKL